MPDEGQAVAERARRTLADAAEVLHRLEHVDPHMVLDLVNDFLILFSNVHGESNLVCQVHPDPAVRATAEGHMREALRLRTQMHHSPRIFELLGSLDESQLEPLAWRAVTLTRRDMRRFGVNLSDADRERIRSLRDELIELEQAFARNIREDRRHIQLSGSDALDGLPTDYVASHPPARDGQVHVTTSYPDYYHPQGDAPQVDRTRGPRPAVPARRHDLTVLGLAVPQLSADLKPSGAQLLWIVDIYGFMLSGSLITMGTLGHRIGRRKLLLIGAVPDRGAGHAAAADPGAAVAARVP